MNLKVPLNILVSLCLASVKADSRNVGISGIDEVEVVCLVPEVCVQRDHPETVLILDGICGVMDS